VRDDKVKPLLAALGIVLGAALLGGAGLYLAARGGGCE